MSRAFFGALVIELRLADNHSLKGKRQVVRSLRDRIRNQFNVAVAELEPLDDRKRAVLGLAAVSKDRPMVESILNQALRFAEDAHLAQIVDSHLEIW